MMILRKKILIAVFVVAVLLLTTPSTGYSESNSLSPGTTVTAALAAGTNITFVGTVDGVPLTVTCTGFTANGNVPSTTSYELTLSRPPTITGCTDSLDGTDTITTDSTNGQWALTENAAAPYTMALTIPEAGAAFTSSALPAGCVITWAPTEADPVTGSYDDTTGVVTVTKETIPTNGVGCTSTTTSMTATIDLTPNPGMPPFYTALSMLDMTGLACPSKTTCLAVGSASYQGSITGIIAPIVSGVAGAAIPVAGANFLYGISCVSNKLCYAVGQNAAETTGLLASIPVADLTATTVSSVSDTSALYGITCPAASSCVAVGEQDTPVVVPLANGVPGTVSGVGNQPGQLLSVVCPTATLCFAAGSVVESGADVSSGIFSAIVGGSPYGATLEPSGPLSGVACQSATECLISGSESAQGQESTDVPTAFLGTVSTSTPGGPALLATHLYEPGGFSGITCPVGAESDSCLAVGFTCPAGASWSTCVADNYYGSGVVSVASGNSLDEASVSDLHAIACPTATLCEAVGQPASALTTKVRAP